MSDNKQQKEEKSEKPYEVKKALDPSEIMKPKSFGKKEQHNTGDVEKKDQVATKPLPKITQHKGG